MKSANSSKRISVKDTEWSLSLTWDFSSIKHFYKDRSSVLHKVPLKQMRLSSSIHAELIFYFCQREQKQSHKIEKLHTVSVQLWVSFVFVSKYKRHHCFLFIDVKPFIFTSLCNQTFFYFFPFFPFLFFLVKRSGWRGKCSPVKSQNQTQLEKPYLLLY